MMRIAIDCRMCTKSGIGAFIDGILPYFLETDNEFLLVGLDKSNPLAALPQSIYENKKADFLPCSISPFSIKETFFFPSASLT